jgi:alanine dehydrogenase
MSSTSKTGLQDLAKQGALSPQEALLEVKKSNKQLLIGIPKELDTNENRIVLTPEAVSILVNNGHQLYVETGAGEFSKFSDKEYSDAGAHIAYSAREVYEADIILKVDPPTQSEIQYIKPGKTLISALQMAKLSPEYISAINAKKITAVGFELIQDKVGGMPVVRAMSEIAGSTVMLIAAEYLNSVNGKGIILGGITGVPPTKVVILGSGTVAEFRCRTALGLGAKSRFSTSIYINYADLNMLSAIRLYFNH